MKKRTVISMLSLLLISLLVFASCGSSYYDMSAPEEAVMEMEDSYSYASKSEENGTYYRDASDVKERMLVYTVDYTLETKEFTAACDTLENKAAELGGYVKSYNSYTGGYSSSIDYSFRIPSSALDEFTELVESLGTVTRKNTDVQDYTDTYYDYQTEISLLKTEEEYVEKYLDLATDSGERSGLIDQLLSIRREIARLERASQNITTTVTYSTVDIAVREVTVYTDIKVSYGDTLLSAFKEGWEGFVDFCRELLYAIVRNSPLFMIAILIFLAIFIPVKISGKRKKKKMLAFAQAQAQAVKKDIPEDPRN